MIELSLLGPHALRGPDGRERGGVAAQPKRFGLLACLTLARGRYLRRDALTAILWTELDQFAARRALRNTLYHLREALGNGVIVTQGDEGVAIDPAMLTSDVARLGDAMREARYQEVVDGYRGELLAGFHIPDAGDAFESWLSEERRKLREMVLAAAAALADREEAAGNFSRAAYWSQRACAIAPEDERWLRRTVTLLDQSGDTGSALHLADAWVARLANEYQATPHPDTVALIARIRGSARPPMPEHEVATPHFDGAPASSVHDRTVTSAPALPSRHPPFRASRWLPAAIGISAVVSLMLFVLGQHRAERNAAHPRVLVTVFDNRSGDSALRSLGRMAQDWLTEGLVRTGMVDVVDPRAVFVQSQRASDPVDIAHRTGASLLVSGSYYRSGDSVFLAANVLDAGNGRVLRTVGPIVSHANAPVGGLDELRSRVMTALASVVDRRATQDLDGSEVPPFEAYLAYVQGWDAFWHGDGWHAETLFLHAAQRDTAFAPAVAAAASTASNAGDCRLVDSLAMPSTIPATPFARVDRLTIDIAVALCHGRNDEMLRLALERADLEPGTSSVQISAAAAALWANRPARALEILRRIDPATDLAWNTDTTHFDYWSDLTEVLHLLGRYRDELDAADQVSRAAPLSRAWMRGRALAALGRPTAVLALIDSAMPLSADGPNVGLAPGSGGRPQYTATPAWVAVWIARELLVHGDSVAARQAAARAVAWYRSRPPDERDTPEERLVMSWSLELTGDYAGARRVVQQLVDADSAAIDAQGELAVLAVEQGDTVSAHATDRWLAAHDGWAASLYRAELAALSGEADSALARLRDARDHGAWPLWIHLDPAFNTLMHRPEYVALMAVQR